MDISAKSSQLIERLKKQIESFRYEREPEHVGFVTRVADGIVHIKGLDSVMAGEILILGENTPALVLNLGEHEIGAAVLGEFSSLHENTPARSTGHLLETPVGEQLLGRVVDPLGNLLDGGEPVETKKTLPTERIAPSVIERAPVDKPVLTGIKVIDSLVPIGRGQRELILGDRQTGKTSLVLDTIINQKGKNLYCIYVAIGQKEAKVARVVQELKEHGALDYTTIVLAGADDPASLVYLAPYAGCALGEYFMEQGKDALVVYDDLTKHAWAYRQLSLLLRRPPGREAYPGDVFYLHSRLLERACKLNEKRGGGSLTALPIVETQAGDISAYIPTNVISITDGQIYLESDLFYSGTRPALNIGLSVSRVGSKAQTKLMKKIAGNLKLEMAQYRELAAFAQFGSDLDKKTREQIERGRRIAEVLKQGRLEPLGLGEEIAIVFAAVNGLLRQVQTDKIVKYEQEFVKYFRAQQRGLLEKLVKAPDWIEALKRELQKAIETFNQIAPVGLFIKQEKEDGQSHAKSDQETPAVGG